jgi:hypothetical protein
MINQLLSRRRFNGFCAALSASLPAASAAIATLWAGSMRVPISTRDISDGAPDERWGITGRGSVVEPKHRLDLS